MLEARINDQREKINKSMRDEHNALMRAFADYENARA
jgi:hypothetical protein